MFILFLLFWIILNGRVTAEILLIGALLTLFVSFFFYRLLGWRLQYDKILVRNLPLLLLYAGNLIWEILLSTFHVMKLIWNPSGKPDPLMVEFHSGLSGSFLNVLLANSITLTPGTFTVVQEGDRFVIHCLRPEYAEGLDDSSFIHLLRRFRI